MVESILEYLKTQDVYTLVVLGLLFAIVFFIILYKSSQKPKTIYHDSFDEEIYDDESLDTSMADVHSERSSTSDDPAAKKVWLVIDIVGISICSVITYTLFFEEFVYILYRLGLTGSFVFMAFILINIIFYFVFFKPTILNTKPKK